MTQKTGSAIKRYSSLYPFPDYTYVPGKGLKDEHRRDLPHFHSKKLQSSDWHCNEAYLYGIDLYNHDFMFEAHEVWEELWFVCGIKSLEGQFLKALIQLAAARLKTKLQEPKPAARLVQSIRKILELISIEHKASYYMGLNLNDLTENLWASRLPESLEPKFE